MKIDLERFKLFPEVLQKHIVLRFGIGILFLVLSIFILLFYRDMSLLIPCLVFGMVFLFIGVQLYRKIDTNQYVIVDGICSEVDKGFFRKRAKTIYMETINSMRVEIIVKQRIKHIKEGDAIRVYLSNKTPVYDHNGNKLICTYIALEKIDRRDIDGSK